MDYKKMDYKKMDYKKMDYKLRIPTLRRTKSYHQILNAMYKLKNQPSKLFYRMYSSCKNHRFLLTRSKTNKLFMLVTFQKDKDDIWNIVSIERYYSKN